VFEPKFKISKKIILSDIQKITKTQQVWIEGYKTPVDDTLDISLNVQLINAREIPQNKDSIISIQKRVASKLKYSLKNPSQFKTYRIIFIQRDTIKGNFGTITSENGLYDHNFYANSL
jgi:hypothetical protein